MKASASRIHVIVGEDDGLVEEVARKIIGDGVGLETVDSLNSTNMDTQLEDIKRADESFSTPPFLDPRKVTWWKNVHFLPGGRSSEEVRDALERFAARLAAAELPENQHFILTGPHLLKTSRFAKELAGKVEIVVMASGKPAEMQRRAVSAATEYAAELGFKFGPDVAERFVAIVGTDTRSLRSEVGKLRDYLGKTAKIAAAADVEAIASAGVKDEPEFWSLSDAIGRRDAQAALAALRPFELESGFAVMMSGVIERCFRQLVDVKRGNTEGMNPWALQKVRGFASKWELIELRRARARFLELREKVVSGTVAGDTLVVTELLRALRRVRKI